MRKKLRLGFSSILTLGGVLLLAATVILGVYLVGQKVGFKPRASEPVIMTAAQEALSLAKVNQNLKIVPTISTDSSCSSCINLSLSWDPVVNVPSFQYFTLAIYKGADYKPVPGGQEANVGQETTKQFTNLPVGNGDYYVHLKVVFSAGSPKLDKEIFAYYENNFDKDKTIPQPFNLDKGNYGKISLNKGAVNIQEFNPEKPEQIYVWANVLDFAKSSRLTKAYDTTVMVRTPKTANIDSSDVAYAINASDSFIVGVSQHTDSVSQNVYAYSYSKSMGFANKSVYKMLPLVTGPSTISIRSSDGKTVVPFYNGQALADSPIAIKDLVTLAMRVYTWKPGLPTVTGLFDDFKVVWVK